MFWKKSQDISEDCHKKLSEFGETMHKVVRDIEDIRDKLDKLEIKALESRKTYHTKLKKLFGEEERESETNKNPSVFLNPNGAPL